MEPKKDPVLDDITSLVIAYPGEWQPIIKIIDVEVDKLTSIQETLFKAGIAETAGLKLSDTTEVAILFSPGAHRMRTAKARVLARVPEELVREIVQKFEVA